MSVLTEPGPRIGGMFFGVGGLDMAVQRVMGGELAWVSEIDEGACKVIAHRHPGVPNLGDVRLIDWSQVEPVEVATAGFPCTDVSSAGKRAGLVHGTRSGLFHEVIRMVRGLRPPLLVIENVRGLLSSMGDDPTPELMAAEATRDAADRLATWLERERRWALTKGDTDRAERIRTRAVRVMGLRRRAVARARRAAKLIVRAIGTVLGSLADVGYDAIWYGLPASSIGAPHERWRVFILAWPADAGLILGEPGGGPSVRANAGRATTR